MKSFHLLKGTQNYRAKKDFTRLFLGNHNLYDDESSSSSNQLSSYNPEDDGLFIEKKLQQNEQTEKVENPETPPEVVTEDTIVYLSKPTVEK